MVVKKYYTIILELYQGELSYIWIFPEYVRMALIFTDFPTGSVEYWIHVVMKQTKMYVYMYNCRIFFY